MAKKHTDISNAQKLGIGVGLTAAAVAAAGAYFLYGSKSAPKNRKTVRSWALKAKGEVLEALEKADKMTQGEFNQLVEGVVNTYAKVEKLSRNELSEFKKEMGENWTGLMKSGVAKVFDSAPKVTPVKTPAKKVVTKKVVTKQVVAKITPKIIVKKVAPKVEKGK